MRFSVRLAGYSSIALTKLDVLDGYERIPIAAAYRDPADGREWTTVPASTSVYERLEPVYEELAGWRADTTGCRAWAELPPAARAYVERLESAGRRADQPRQRRPRARADDRPMTRAAINRPMRHDRSDERQPRPIGAIQVSGARENNLRDISLDIPKRQLTVFTGVSGSGKSSLVFETIAAESRRLINETYTAFLQGFMATPSRPDVDSLENLTAAIIVDQERMGANARSTVGTATDAYDMLRVIFSRLGQPYIGPSSAFSASTSRPARSAARSRWRRGRSETESREITITGGMCPECEGLGRVSSGRHRRARRS